MSKEKDPQAKQYSRSIANQFDNALTYIASAQVPFADLLDRMNELGVSYEDGDGATVAKLMDEATAKLKEAAELIRTAGVVQCLT